MIFACWLATSIIEGNPGSAGELSKFDSCRSQSDKLPPVNRSKFHREELVRSRTSGLRINIADLSCAVCVVSINRSSALETGFPNLVQPCWPASEHTSTAQRHDHQRSPWFSPRATGAMAAPERATPLAATTHGQSSRPPSPAYMGRHNVALSPLRSDVRAGACTYCRGAVTGTNGFIFPIRSPGALHGPEQWERIKAKLDTAGVA